MVNNFEEQSLLLFSHRRREAWRMVMVVGTREKTIIIIAEQPKPNIFVNFFISGVLIFGKPNAQFTGYRSVITAVLLRFVQYGR